MKDGHKKEGGWPVFPLGWPSAEAQPEVFDGVLGTHRDRTGAISNLGVLRPQRDYRPWQPGMSARILDTEARWPDAVDQSCRRRAAACRPPGVPAGARPCRPRAASG